MVSQLKRAVFFLDPGTLLTHELDAIVQREWVLLPCLRSFLVVGKSRL